MIAMRESVSRSRARDMLATAFGPVIMSALNDPCVIEIMLNPDGHLWIERQGAQQTDCGGLMAAEHAERAIRLVATLGGRELTPTSPIVSAELPMGGERFEAVMPSCAAHHPAR